MDDTLQEQGKIKDQVGIKCNVICYFRIVVIGVGKEAIDTSCSLHLTIRTYMNRTELDKRMQASVGLPLYIP